MVKGVGYAAQPLDGSWQRAPYLHNGSVPTRAALLEVPEARPAVFWQGCDIYDPEAVGFRTARPDDDCPRAWRVTRGCAARATAGTSTGPTCRTIRSVLSWRI